MAGSGWLGDLADCLIFKHNRDMERASRSKSGDVVIATLRFTLNSFGFAIVALGSQTFVQFLWDKVIEPDILKAALFGIAFEAGRQMHRHWKV